MTWLYDTSCSVPPCGPPGFVQYRIEVESGSNDGFGNIIWSGTVVSYTMNELNTEPNPEFSAYVGQRTEFARFRVKIVNATDCNPWSYWQVCTA